MGCLHNAILRLSRSESRRWLERRGISATDLAAEAAVAGIGIITHFEDWLRQHLDSGALRPVPERW
jgi:hypothetical protein